MPSPLDKTFTLLSKRSSPDALEALEAASEVPILPVQMRAVKELLKKKTAETQVNLLRKWKSFLPSVKSEIEQKKGVLEKSVHRALSQNDVLLQQQTLEFVVGTSDYSQIGTLLQLLQQKDHPLQKQLVIAERQLVDSMFDQLQQPQASQALSGPETQELIHLQNQVVSQLNGLIPTLDDSACADFVIESLLILGAPEEVQLGQIFTRGSKYLRKMTGEMLQESKHPGVMQFIVDSMGVSSPETQILEVIQHRTDPEFVNHFLTELPEKMNANQVNNFRKIRNLDWINPEESHLEEILPALHLPFLRMLNSCSLGADDMIGAQKWLIENSGPEVRLAATEVLMSLDNRSMSDMFEQTLDSTDPNLQAWATSQLRYQNIPNRYELLLDRIDSEIPEVRKSAREELKGFTLEMMLSQFEGYSLNTNRQGGVLLKKLDPQFIPKLTQKICSTRATEKIRAANCAYALGVHVEVFPALMTLLTHPDTTVRRTGVILMGKVATRESLELLVKMKNDPSPRVRATVIETLRSLLPSNGKGQ